MEMLLQALEAEVDKIETQIAYKEGQIEELRIDRISHDGSATAFDRAILRVQAECEEILEKLDGKKEEIAALKDKLRKKEAKLAAIAPVESTDAPDPEDNQEAAALLGITNTPKSDVFVVSEDGQTFESPAMLRGVPVAPINETGPYWDPMWINFADAVDQDRIERQYQEDVLRREQRQRDGLLTAEEKENTDLDFKRYQRRMNEARVAKKWFCPGRTMHPNQLLAKEYLPEAGLCQPYILYKICNILNRLNALYERGELGMPPLCFLLWRMSVSLDREPQTRVKTFWKVIVNEHHSAYDEILRKAEIRESRAAIDPFSRTPSSAAHARRSSKNCLDDAEITRTDPVH
ncbi:hypothetical protein CCHL11_08043 [Colletotrichum chlorophyti]|uniref:Uncharacterized protein n=1 Tax=Colletotrichum chlorophyti TaxID=708187 RepID=A0A1Q8RME2_9PEZI|nr:hypothetical protein CCHL11_08043 [Colletotrichum chlorophyti]